MSEKPRDGSAGPWPVPKVSEFYGVIVRMHHNEHGPPHFHAEYGGVSASFSLDGRISRGNFPQRARRLVREWARMHAAELARNWALAREGRELVAIEPLE